jgi:hypothetical protein
MAGRCCSLAGRASSAREMESYCGERGGAAWESHGEDNSMCMLIGQRVGWLWAVLSFLLAFSFLFSFPYSFLQDGCLVCFLDGHGVASPRLMIT